MRIGFFQQRLPFDFQLHDAPFDFIDFRRQGINLHAQTRSRFVNQIDRFVRQKAVGNIALRQCCSGNNRSVLNAHAVVYFIALF